MPLKEIAVASLVATSTVTSGPQTDVLYGGDLALVATHMCMADYRDMNNEFLLIRDYDEGYFKVRCEMIQTHSGHYYASSGHYYQDSEMLDVLVDMFDKARTTN